MKVGFVSLGCPKNLVDTEVMMGLLAARGHEMTSKPEDADVLVVNTCSFIDPAKQESVDTILEMAEFKRTGQARRLIVTGCLVERYRDEIQRSIPDVDAVLGTNQLESIVAVCEGGQPAPAVEPYLYHEFTPRLRSTPRHYAYIKIAEGCDHPCSFCVIPQFRGRFRSRRFESVVAEAARLFAEGVREINLIGQDTTSYGEDLGLRDGLALLLERLAQIETEHPKWIRFLYAYPNRVTPKLLDTLAAHDALVKYVDIPFQHASAFVLKRMKRGGCGDQFLRLIERIRRTIPGVALRTSFIVGFPGETDRDFEELCQFVEAARFDRLGVFSYSDEETSESFHLPDKVDRRTVYHRKRRLLALQRRISRANLRRLVGQEFTVLVEGPSRESELLWEARLATQAPEIDGVCFVNDVEGPAPQPGCFRKLRVTRALDYDLIGTLVGHAEPQRRRTSSPFVVLDARRAQRPAAIGL
ncbi:MAG: 30S ribosomal protein S12 methylthiotransferase RimO [Bryobacterales bacterium]|nr:30S ribosomal protein S12 methylthiotransferase RimO [Bryobacteraceae bacterium]MDW8353861.1 30S ribosomal protein S12 methylthiotransferase RimO [Bryobacterales bacterium]